MYDSVSEIDPKGIFTTLNTLCLLGDDIYLRSQAFNLDIVDKFITDLEYKGKRLFFPRRQAKQLDLEAQLLLSNSRAEIDPMPRVRSACQVWESQ